MPYICKNKNKMGRPKLKEKKVSISITINEELNKKLEKFLEEKKLSKSEYIEYLIKKDKST
jgi:hypothetical protein